MRFTVSTIRVHVFSAATCGCNLGDGIMFNGAEDQEGCFPWTADNLFRPVEKGGGGEGEGAN